ncbi:MAG: flagellar basal body P-ring formation chaperone FlgA [Candidatus Latescibacterota bacterium]
MVPFLFPAVASAGTVSSGTIAAAIGKTVREYAGMHNLDVEVDVPHVRDVEVNGCETPDIRAILTAKKIRGVMAPVRVEFRNGSGDLLKRANFVARVKTFDSVVVALRDIPKGDSLRTEDLAVKRMDVSGCKDACDSPEELDGVCTRFPIKAGEVIQSGALRPVPLIRRGDRVAIRAVVGSVELASEGIARQDGGKGEAIRVYSETTRTSLVGRVLDSKTVMAGKDGK